MNKQTYHKARRMIRQQGISAVQYFRMSAASELLKLANQKPDPLEEKAAALAFIAKYERAYNV